MTRALPAKRPARSTTPKKAIPPKARERFLGALAAGWSVTQPAERGGHARQRFYELREHDEAFAAAWAARARDADLPDHT
jgi:hypothetical protein